MNEETYKKLIHLLACFAYSDWSESNYAAGWYSIDGLPDDWLEQRLRPAFTALLTQGFSGWDGPHGCASDYDDDGRVTRLMAAIAEEVGLR